MGNLEQCSFVLAILLLCGGFRASGQRYAERNPLPADTLPMEDIYEEDYDYTEGYGFPEEESNIYRWNVKEFPHPRENPRFCNRLKPSNICDPDSVLQKEQVDRLDTFINELYKETPCICEDCSATDGGIVVGIALLKNMFQPYNEHPAKIIRSFAEKLRAKWKLGKCDNDILIVIATTDRLSYTDVGRATSSYVSVEEAHRIFLENKAHFSAGHFYEGLRAMLADYHKNTRDMKRPVQKELDMALVSGVIIGAIFILGLVLFLVFVIYRRCRRIEESQKSTDSMDGNAEGVSSSWTKQDIKIMFGSMKSSEKQKSSTKYQPCKTDEKDTAPEGFREEDEEEVIDTSLAIPEDNSAINGGNANDTQLTSVVSGDESANLEKELTTAVEGIAQTFQKPKREYTGHMTDL